MSEVTPSGTVTMWRTMRPWRMSSRIAAIEARFLISYSPAFRERAAPVTLATVMKIDDERITPPRSRVEAISGRLEPLRSTTEVMSPDFAAGPGPL
jgi:hypothetical protein